jgi:hypothetical protein
MTDKHIKPGGTLLGKTEGLDVLLDGELILCMRKKIVKKMMQPDLFDLLQR